MSQLDEIFTHKRAEIARQKAAVPLAEMTALAAAAPPTRGFVAALRQACTRPALIAEIKRGSPSRGTLARDFDPLRLARTYADNGASAISVLTDEKYFGGSLDHLRMVAALMQTIPTKVRSSAGAEPVEASCVDDAAALRRAQGSILAEHGCVTMQAYGLPLLRKDFICDPYQVYQARAAGADAILLIAAELAPVLLTEFHGLARSLGMAALVEVHDEAELETALTCGAQLIGVNNRNLHDFTVSLDTTLRLGRRVPAEVCLVAESGIHTAADVDHLCDIPRPGGVCGVDAILVGEALVTAIDAGAKVRELADSPRRAAAYK